MRWITTLISAAVFTVSLVTLARVSGQSPCAQKVREVLAEQDRWLSDQSSGPGWNSYLQTADLKRQLDDSKPSDQGVLHAILGKYESGAPGLTLAQFAATRSALTAWVKDISQPSLADLAAQVRAAKDSYKPVSKATVLQREVATEAAVRRLDRYLKSSGTNGQGWISYLHLADLQTVLKNGINADAKVLHEMAARYSNGSPGLELSQFQGVATSLGSYADLLAAYQNGDAKAANAKDLEALADSLDSAAKQPSLIDRTQVGELLAHISASGQNEALVQAVRHRLSQPNLLIRVSGPIVVAGIDDDVNEITPVKDVILGTDVEGQGKTVGKVRASLVPSTDRAVVQVMMTGNTYAKTVGYHGIVTVFSHGNTSLSGRKQIQIDQTAFTGLPACAECCTNNNIDCVDVCAGPLITRFATNRVYASQGEAEEIAGEHAAGRLETRMDTRTGDMLANVNRGFNQKFRYPLIRLSAYPQQLDFSSTRDWMFITGLQARANELAASTPAPEPSADAQLSVRVHESVIENLVSATMAGRTIHDERFKRMLRNIGGKKLSEDEFKVMLRNLGEADESYDDFSALLQDRTDQKIEQAQFNVLVQAIRDKKVTSDQVDHYFSGLVGESLTAEKVNTMLGDLPEASQATLTLAESQPVTLRFRDGSVDVTLHAQAYSSRNGVERDVPMDIRAVYKVAIQGGQMVATRQGELEISPPGFKPGDKLDIQQTSARGALRGRFDEIFKQELKSTGLTLRGKWKKLGELPWAQADLVDGWAAAGWAMPSTPKTAPNESPDAVKVAVRQ